MQSKKTLKHASWQLSFACLLERTPNPPFFCENSNMHRKELKKNTHNASKIPSWPNHAYSYFPKLTSFHTIHMETNQENPKVNKLTTSLWHIYAYMSTWSLICMSNMQAVQRSPPKYMHFQLFQEYFSNMQISKNK